MPRNCLPWCTTSVLAACLLQTSFAGAQNVFCSPAVGRGRVDANLDVATRCELEGADVRGNVTLFAGGSLIARDVRIRGDLAGNGGDFVDVRDGRIDGDLRLEQMVGDVSRIEDTNVRGGVTLLANRSRLELIDNEIRRDVDVVANTGGVLIVANTIDDELVCEANVPAPLGGANRVRDADDEDNQCTDLQPVAAADPPPSPAPPSPPPDASPPPASDPGPAGFVPDPEGGGGGAMGAFAALLLPFAIWRRVRAASRASAAAQPSARSARPSRSSDRRSRGC